MCFSLSCGVCEAEKDKHPVDYNASQTKNKQYALISILLEICKMFCVFIVRYVFVADEIIFPLLSFAHTHISKRAASLRHSLLKMRLRLGAADREKLPRGLETVVTIMQFWN